MRVSTEIVGIAAFIVAIAKLIWSAMEWAGRRISFYIS